MNYWEKRYADAELNGDIAVKWYENAASENAQRMRAFTDEFSDKIRSVLDFGCGTAVHRYTFNAEYNGCDVVMDMLRKNSMKYGDCFFYSSPSNIKKQYDLIFCVYSLQHVPDSMLDAYLDAFSKHTKYLFVYEGADKDNEYMWMRLDLPARVQKHGFVLEKKKDDNGRMMWFQSRA